MRERDQPWLILTIWCVVLLANASSANAQSWLSDRKRAEGHGIRLGDLELHPGVGAEFGYYTNPFYSEHPNEAPSAAFRISPHLFMSTLGPERTSLEEGTPTTPPWVNFSGGLAASYQHYFLFAARDVLNTDLNLDLTLAPDRPVGLRLVESLNRSANPFSDANLPPADSGAPVNVDNAKAPNYTRYTENASVALLFQSAGGLLRASVGYRFGYLWFDDTGFKYNNTLTHTATLTGAWEFLPKTALFYEGQYARPTYPNQDNRNLEGTSYSSLIDSHQISSRLGLNGAITSRLGATVSVGYSAGFYSRGNDFEGLIGTVEARFLPSDLAEIALGFDRAFQASYLGNYLERNRIYARFRWLFVGALMVTTRAGIEFLSFGFDERQAALNNPQPAREDRRYFVDLSGEYRFIDWLALTAQVSIVDDDTDFSFFPPSTLPGVAADPAKFTALEFWLGVRAFY